MLLGTLGDSLLGNLLTGWMRTGEGSIRAGENFKFGSILNVIKYKNVIKMSLNVMVFIE